MGGERWCAPIRGSHAQCILLAVHVPVQAGPGFQRHHPRDGVDAELVPASAGVESVQQLVVGRGGVVIAGQHRADGGGGRMVLGDRGFVLSQLKVRSVVILVLRR
jgi:hypothetical protein